MNQAKELNITILGAGLAGSLLASLLARQGHKVTVYEKRPDPRKIKKVEGRSINLALSFRGLEALKKAGADRIIQQELIPMRGRMIHGFGKELQLQPYGKRGQYINSVSRVELNRKLISQSEEKGAVFYFNHTCERVDLPTNRAWLKSEESTKEIQPDLLIGADGAFSALRAAMQITPRYNYSQHYIEHGYKELTIPPTAEGAYAMDPNALHIWPRGGFMLIALPNPDRSFTCTLFLPYEGEVSFAALNTESKVLDFFRQTFPDAVPLMPDLQDEFFRNPLADLVTIRCYPWTYNGRQLLIGDAAHAIVPFYGQGMNAAFEDCRILANMLEGGFAELPELVQQFQAIRKPDADAIAELALQNFIEMRDLVADPAFLRRKQIEARLHEAFPDKWIPLYTMVTFSDMRYSDALRIGRRQEEIMRQVMRDNPRLEVEELDLAEIAGML
ncbi:MAG: FAD-dependent oxidoreductase [Cyclobacteriaceae bacterium]